jgi:hypothetical protein
MDRQKLQVYVDSTLYESLVSKAKAENLSVSRYAERLLAEKSTGAIDVGVSQAIESMLLAHLSPIRETLDRLVSQSESLPPVSQSESLPPVSQSESLPPVSQSELLPRQPDTILQNLHGCVLILDGEIREFWTGKGWSTDPKRMKLYRSPPTKRTVEAIESAARLRGGQGKYNELFNLLKLMGYPHNFGTWETLKVERHWVESNLLK